MRIPDASQYLAQIRQLLFDGKQKEAEDLAMQEFMSVPLHQKAYQAFGDLLLDFSGIPETEVSGYRRDLNLDTAVSTVSYTFHGVIFRREVFASYPAKAIIVRFTANKAGSVTFESTLKSAHGGSEVAVTPSGELAMSGAVEESAIRFQALLDVETQGGMRAALSDGRDRRQKRRFRHSDSDRLDQFYKLSGRFRSPGSAQYSRARGVAWQVLRRTPRGAHRRLPKAVSPRGSGPGNISSSGIAHRRAHRGFRQGQRPALVAMLFQYGRYLMIGSSRPGGQPANLQGLWNESNSPPWDSKYTDNINTEMNYWPVEESNLSECHLPLFDALKDLAVSGARTAKEQYAARGWVLHHNFDLWRGTAPINASNHGIWETGGAWLSTHLWEHYLFTGDRQFLRDTAYPLMKGAAMFFVRCPGERSENRLPDHRSEQFAGAGRAGDGPDHGSGDCARAVWRDHCRRQNPERGRRSAPAARRDAQTHRTPPDRAVRAVAGVDGR